ncbi:TPA: hypothetical protein UL927_002809 [Stenotrophomonas maltophilia]|nr:hypothetical protein [Stenotrophomonas maltophilia]
MKPIVLALALALSAPAAFAADSTSARRYGSSEALSVQDARLGEVLIVRTVQLKSDQRLNAGSAIGAAVGYGAARKVDGDYRNAARVAGGVIGAVAGTALQKGLSGQRAVEIYVRDLSDRRQRVLAVVQDADVDVREGDRVFLVGKGKKTRVVPLDASPERIGDYSRAVPLDASPVRIGDYSCGSPCAIGINARSDDSARVGP